MTVGELISYLALFKSDTKVVLGQVNTSKVVEDIHANTYYPQDLNRCEQWVVIDPGPKYQ